MEKLKKEKKNKEEEDYVKNFREEGEEKVNNRGKTGKRRRWMYLCKRMNKGRPALEPWEEHTEKKEEKEDKNY